MTQIASAATAACFKAEPIRTSDQLHDDCKDDFFLAERISRFSDSLANRIIKKSCYPELKYRKYYEDVMWENEYGHLLNPVKQND